MLPDRQVKIIDFNQPIVIPTLQPPSRFDRVLSVLRELAGIDGSDARNIALGTIGATRSLDANFLPITMPGMIGLGQQYVDVGRSLHMRWSGGAEPFRLELISAETKDRPLNQISTTSERYARVNLSQYPLGLYDLIIVGAEHIPLTLRLRLVTPSDVPSPQGVDPLADEEARELVNAVWLLTRAPSPWRLEALSRLETLAREHDDIIAQVILDPALPLHKSAKP
jgi:hypothetical protein